MIKPDTLNDMTRDQLKDIALKLDIKIHHKARDQKIREEILTQLASRQMATPVVEESKPEPIIIKTVKTQDEVLEAIKDQVAKEGFKATFPGDDTVIFTYRGISESIHLSSPLHIIKRQALMAAKTKYAPAMVKDGALGNTGIMMMT